jgi:hypothetical protein
MRPVERPAQGDGAPDALRRQRGAAPRRRPVPPAGQVENTRTGERNGSTLGRCSCSSAPSRTPLDRRRGRRRRARLRCSRGPTRRRPFPTATGSRRRHFCSRRPWAGVFAVGDVRAGSVKRVASAVDEGSMVVRLVHEYLDEVVGPTTCGPRRSPGRGGAWRARPGEGLVEPGAKDVLRGGSGLAGDHLPVVDDEERGDALHAVTAGDLG